MEKRRAAARGLGGSGGGAAPAKRRKGDADKDALAELVGSLAAQFTTQHITFGPGLSCEPQEVLGCLYQFLQQQCGERVALQGRPDWQERLTRTNGGALSCHNEVYKRVSVAWRGAEQEGGGPCIATLDTGRKIFRGVRIKQSQERERGDGEGEEEGEGARRCSM